MPVTDWIPESPLKGPPLPQFMNVLWPWVKGAPGPTPTPEPTPSPTNNATYRQQLATVLSSVSQDAANEFLTTTSDDMTTIDLYDVYEQVAQKYYAAPVPKPTPTPSPTPMPGPAPAPTPTPTPAPPNAAYRAQLATVIEALGANAKSEFLASTTDNMSTTDLYAVYSQVVNKYYKPTPTPTPAPTPTPTPAPTPTPTANNGTYRQQLASDIEYLAGSQWKTTFLSRTSDSDSTDQLLAQRNAVLADWAATV